MINNARVEHTKNIHPLKIVAKMFLENHPDGDFATEIAWYLANGVVFSNSEYAILARPCDTMVPESYAGAFDKWLNGEPNAWYCAYAAGNGDALVRAILAVRPKYRYIVFDRHKNNNGNKIIKTERFIRYVK